MNLSAIDPDELPEGMTLLGRYSIIDRVAGGGMATIYRAMDERLDRVVCVKLLRSVVEPSGSSSGGGGGGSVYQATYSHFLKEALALSKLHHPNTLRIYDFGYLGPHAGASRAMVSEIAPEEERPFQVSEFLDGGNLEQHVHARGALSKAEVLAILDRMAGALAEAHEHRIIHRDIKPSNILFSRIGDVLMPKLADFGIARCDLRKRPRPGEAPDPVVVTSTIPLFSPRWAAPEQLAAGEEGPSTDVYALALLAAYMLSGRMLFHEMDIRSSFTERVRGDDYVEARLVDFGFGDATQRVLLEALRANPKVRTSSPLALAEGLARALAEQPSIPPETKRDAPPEVKPPRPSFESITLDVVDPRLRGKAQPPSERWVDLGPRRARIVAARETMDVHLANEAAELRFRVTLLPARGGGFQVNLKGLNCFVAKPGASASPALVSDRDGDATFVSMQRAPIGAVSWFFGELLEGGGRAFTVDGLGLILPPNEAQAAVALDLGADREIIVICRRA